ncbi:MAG: hypothetical protein ACLRQF_24665 [Thomasclavelia ramosa]
MDYGLLHLFYVLAIVFMIVGFIHLFTLPGAGLIYMGLICPMALGTIFGKMAAWFFKDCIPGIANAIADGLGRSSVQEVCSMKRIYTILICLGRYLFDFAGISVGGLNEVSNFNFTLMEFSMAL